MKKILLILVILLLCGCNNTKEERNTYEFITSYNQDLYKEKINEYMNNDNCTFLSPCVINNPFKNSSLTSLIIFKTDKSTSIDLYINDILSTTMEDNTIHSIPVYGLKEGLNKIKLVDADNNIKELEIKTTGLSSMIFKYTSSYDKNNPLFLNSSSGKYALNNEGLIIWESANKSMDLSFYNSYKYLTQDEYDRIIMTDLMGQIYNTYNYAHNENHKVKSYDDYFIYTDYNYDIVCYNYDNELLWKINLYDIFLNIDPNFKDNFNPLYADNLSNIFHINEYNYDKDNNTLLISIRSMSTIVYYDLTNKDIIWIFTSSSNFNDNFNKYKLNLKDGTYFYGEHSPILKDNLLYVFDNNFLGNNEVGARGVIYKIDGMDVYQIYDYSILNTSIYGGSIYLEDDLLQINYGSGLDSANYCNIVELIDDEVITTVKYKNLNYAATYSSFRHSMYDEVTSNYEVLNYNNYTKYDNKKYDIDSNFKKLLNKSLIDENLVIVKNDNLKINISTDYKLYFVSNNNYYIYSSNDNISKEGFISSISGTFDIYVFMDDTMYDTNIRLSII